MGFGSREGLAVILLSFWCAFIPSRELRAQQGGTAAPQTAQQIDQLTAPIALYPDALVIQILTASKDYSAILTFAGWLEKNAGLKGTELQAAAQKAGFDASLVALAPFAQVIRMMVEKPDWTKALGQAVTANKKGVFDSIQRLRAQALAAGNLGTTSQQKVETQTNAQGQQVIVIQPANPQVIYVPQYNPQVVYVEKSGGNAAAAAVVGFTAGVIIGAAWHDHYDHHDYWDDREDFYEDRQQNFQQNQDQRQSNWQENQDQRQSGRQENQDQRQSARQENPGQRQSGSAKPPGATASQRDGMGSGGLSGYQSGSTTRAQSLRGSNSLSSSRAGGGARRR